MSDQDRPQSEQGGDQPVPPETPQPPEPQVDPAPPARYADVGADEIGAGKAMAILSYAINFVGLPFCIVPLIMRDNEFSLFHAKQSLMIWIAGMIGFAASSVLACVGIGLLLFPVVWVFVVVVNIIGIVNVTNGEFKPLPLIGPYAEQWFAGIRKASKPPAP